VFDTDKKIGIGLQPSPAEPPGIHQGFGSLFWHCGRTCNQHNSHLGILELGLHPKSCGLWCALDGSQWQNFTTTILAGEQERKKERKKLERNCSDICCAAAAAAAAMSLLVFVLDLSLQADPPTLKPYSSCL